MDFLKVFWARLKESRTVWAILVGLVVIIWRTALPQYPISDAVITQSLMLLGAFIVAENLEGHRPSDEIFKTLMRSRKFQATLAGLFVVLAKAAFPDFDFSDEQVLNFVYAIMAIVGGLGLEGSAVAGNLVFDVEYEEPLG